MRRLLALAVALCTIPSCQGCDDNAVFMVDQVEDLGPIIANIQLLQDSDGDGIFSDDERVLVVDPSPSVDKAVRIDFLVPIEKDILKAPAPSVPPDLPGDDVFISFRGPFPGLPADVVVVVNETSFIDDPNGTELAIGVVYDLDDDLTNPARLVPGPVRITLHLSRIDIPGFEFEDATFFFVVSVDGPAASPPPRLMHFSPSLPDLPGWSRPIETGDQLAGEDFAAFLGRLEASNRIATFEAPLSGRPAPHQPLELEFTLPLLNLVADVEPEDNDGIAFRSATPIPFLQPFAVARSETATGLAPDTEYQISVLSRHAVLSIPALSGTQEESGGFLIANVSDALYDALRADGFSAQDLELGSTVTLRTGPVRITSPPHLASSNVGDLLPDPGSPTGSSVGSTVQFAEPAEGAPDVDRLQIRIQADGTPFGYAVPWVPEPDTLTQAQMAIRDIEKMTFHLWVPSANFDGILEYRVEARSSNGEIIGRDFIRFPHDVIPPEIDNNVNVSNETQDGDLDQLCLVADCDVDHFILSTAEGEDVVLDASSAVPSSCVGGRRKYCFHDVDLGLPDGALEETVVVTVVAVDDQGNRSPGVTFETTARCESIERFVGTGGARLDLEVTAENVPTLAWSDGRDIRYARWQSGEWRAEVVATLPDDTDETSYGFGQTIDLHTSPSGEPMLCLVEGRYRAGDNDASAIGTLRILRRSSTGIWLHTGERDDVRPLGCSMATFSGLPVVAYNRVVQSGSVMELLNTQSEWASVTPLGVAPRTTIRPEVTWDLSLASHGDRLYFSYRTLPVGPFSGVEPSPAGSVGRIRLGYFRQVGNTFPRVEQELLDPSPARRTAPAQVPVACPDCPSGMCNNDFICDSGEGPGCADCCNGDRLCDASEVPTCPDCSSSACTPDGTCSPGEFELCADCAIGPCDLDGVCEPDEPAIGCGDCCTIDGICAGGESAACPDCLRNLCDNDGTCEAGEQGGFQQLTEPVGVTLGVSPRMLVSDAGVELTYLNRTSTFGGATTLVHLHAQVPAEGDPFEFASVASDPRVLGIRGRHGLVFARPGIAHDASTDTTSILYPTNDGAIALMASSAGSPASFHIVDARTNQPEFNSPEVNTVALVMTETGYHLAYRNPLGTDRQVVFARAPEARLFSGPAPISECPNLWRPFSLPIDSLNLAYRDFAGIQDQFWSERCTTSPAPIDRPLQLGGEILGLDEDGTLLKDVLIGVVLQDGRVPLKLQGGVCIPDFPDPQGRDVCDPDVDDTNMSGRQRTTLTSWPAALAQRAAVGVILFDHEPTDSECSPGRQVVQNGAGVWACYECGGDGFAIPGGTQCGGCAAGQFKYASQPRIGERPRRVTVADSVECRQCLDEPVTDGRMAPLLSPDGSSCTRCEDGALPVECSQDSDCEFLGDDWRCAEEVEWAAQGAAPTSGVCVRKCSADCVHGGGSCDVASGACRNGPTTQLACLPPGCDRCWNNTFCGGDQDCPLRHHCVKLALPTEPKVLAPLCVARPLLSTAANSLRMDNPSTPVDEGAQRDAIIELNQTIVSGIASARLPDNATGSLPFFLSSNITDFGLTITDVEVRSEDPSVGGRQGALVLHIKADSAFAELDGLCRHVAIRSPVSAELRYQPYVDWAADPARPQVALALTEVRVNAEAGAITTSGGVVCVPNLGIDIGPSIASRVGEQIHGQTEPLLNAALRVLADPTNELVRCMFVASSPFEDTSQSDNGFHACDDGSTEWPQTVQSIADALVINKAVCQ